jgi:N-acetyl-gamma-glutamyl-phosphate reductase
VTFNHSELIFFATPNGIAMNFAEELVGDGKKIIDLAADFRIKNIQLWEQWYGMKHACPKLVEIAVYGLSELKKNEIKNAKIVANPGCYPTAIQLALYPLLNKKIINEQTIVIDAKSGISGAGKKNDDNLLMAEAYDNFNAYSVQGHRHEPEIEENLKEITNIKDIKALFVPHLLPMVRGIYATIYVDLTEDASEKELDSIYSEAYHQSIFVHFMGVNKIPKTKMVRGSNQCKISLFKRDKKLIILSTIDNLVKGAAGQAIQNMNIMFDYQEDAGLNLLPLAP